MSSAKRNRARILTASGSKKLRERMRSHEVEANAGYKYTLERLGEWTGLDPETVKNVLDCKGSDKRTIARCFESFGLTLEESDHIPATQAAAAPSDPNFVGRDEAIVDLNMLISRNARVIVIQARGGVGKTTLARKYLQQEFGSFLEFPIAKETKDIASIEGLIEEKLRQLGEEPGREFLVSLDRLKRKLQAERIGILIDNLEPALDSAGRFIEAHRRYVELLRVLSDPTVRSLTLITSRERLREVDVTVQHYGLRSLDVKAWEQFFQSRSINAETSALAALHNAYGGNAKAMDIISGAILEDFSSEVEAYWQANQDDLFIERDLEDLVTKQFDRLQQLDPDAYNLLCRMGCYRYQDVPTVPIEGLFCLLWDVPENRHRRVIKSLQDRSLIDYEDGEFWLHPVVRMEAIAQLGSIRDWQIANNRAADFWTSSIRSIESLEELLEAFEAYYHYIEIRDYEQACEVIVRERKNKWFHHKEEGETVGWSFYRLGLFRQIISKMLFLEETVRSPYPASKLHSLLSSMYWAMGDIHRAIEYSNKSMQIANDFLQLNREYSNEELRLKFRSLEVDYLLGMGICKVDLWDLEEAAKYFDSIQKLPDLSTIYYGHCIVSEAYSIFLRAYFGTNEGLVELAEETLNKVSGIDWGLRAKSYGLLFLARAYNLLGYRKKTSELCSQSILFAKDAHYAKLEAQALVLLGETYRVEGKFEQAVLHQQSAIDLSDSIGAKGDLAEAHYQLGLTYQVMGEAEKNYESFQEATRLFSEMEAPKQVKRVRQSMQNSK